MSVDVETEGLGSGPTSWAERDLSAIVSGLAAGTLLPPEPDLGRVEGGGRLLYSGCVNGIAGESGCGKSWTALAVCAQEIADGAHVVYVDFEDTPVGLVGRLMALGASVEDLARFHYVQPSERLDVAAAADLDDVVEGVGASLVVVDSVGEALSVEGLDPNADEQVAAWFRRLPAHLAGLPSGPAVLVLDHVAKVDPSTFWPIGSQRKRAAITGVQYMQRAERPFAKGLDGHAVLRVAKDRHGYFPPKVTAAEMLVRSLDGGERVAITLRAPASAVTVDLSGPDPDLMARVSAALEDAGEPMSGRALRRAVRGKAERTLAAADALVVGGFATVARGAGRSGANLYRFVSPYRHRLEHDEEASSDDVSE